MQNEYIKCKCKSLFLEPQFPSHFPNCGDFKAAFKDFDVEFGKLLKAYSLPEENLLIIRVLLEQYKLVVDQKIKKAGLNFRPKNDLFKENNYQSQPNKLSSNSNIPEIINNQQIKPEKKNSSSFIPVVNNIPPQHKQDIMFIDSNQKMADSMQIDDNEVQKCSNCRKLNIDIYLECIHPICHSCFYKLAENNFGEMKCPECQVEIGYSMKRDVLGKDFDKLEDLANKKLLGNVIICANQMCKSQLVFDKGNVDFNVKTEKGEALSKKAAIHYAENRCRCPTCKLDFCVSCTATPYHMGKTCEEFKSFSESRKCRYDSTVITQKNQGPAPDVCSSEECVLLFSTSCGKKLKCGHNCYGAKGEKKCLSCLNAECKDYKNYFDQNEDSYCSICYSEGLGSCPTVKLKCSHMFHHKCLEKILKNKWIGPKIGFSYLKCLTCKQVMDAPDNPDIQKLIDESKLLLEKIEKMVAERLKIEGIDKDPRLKNPSDPYYGKLTEYAMHKISYYLCSKCKNPYFAGLRDCRGGPENEENNNNNNPNGNNAQYNKNDLVCGGCVNLNGVAGISNCQVHGKDYIEYKCKFCCNISSWFCWGTTHFCEDCHSRQCKGDYVTKYTKEKLPQCPGKNNCKLKIKHPENGEEFALGCAVCRNNSENFKQY